MNVLFLSPTVDTAGLGIGMKRAFDAHGGEWHARAVRCADSWLRYDADIDWDRSDGAQTAEVMSVWAQADVLHIMEMPWGSGFGPRKPTVVQHLGTYYRRNPQVVSAQCQALGATEVADMHDLIRLNPSLGWLPDIQAVDELAALRERTYPGLDDRIRIAHAPTDRTIKSTDLIVAAIERVGRDYPIDFDLIEGVPNAQCLERKARCDLFVDELTLGWGLNATECWAMGIPVVSGIANPETEAMMHRDVGDTLPFVKATPETLDDVLRAMCRSAALRREWGEVGRAHLVAYHAPAAVVARTIGLYERVLGLVPA